MRKLHYCTNQGPRLAVKLLAPERTSHAFMHVCRRRSQGSAPCTPSLQRQQPSRTSKPPSTASQGVATPSHAQATHPITRTMYGVCSSKLCSACGSAPQQVSTATRCKHTAVAAYRQQACRAGPTTSTHLVHIEAHHLKGPRGPQLLVHLLVYLHVTWAAGSSRGFSRGGLPCQQRPGRRSIAVRSEHLCG